MLPPGSCFCVFSPFGDEFQQILNFRAETNCVLYTLDVENDLEQLAALDHDLFMSLKSLKQQAKGDMLTAFDFFRFSRRSLEDVFTKDGSKRRDWRFDFVKALELKKAKYTVMKALTKFIRDFRSGKAKMPKALVAIRFLEEHRKIKRQTMNAAMDQGSPEEIQRQVE